MDVISISAQPRNAGRSEARAVRRAGNVPCVMYGRGVEAVSFSVPQASLKKLIYTQESHRVEIELEGQKYDCIIKEIAFDQVGEQAAHVDFQVLNSAEVITMNVPLRFHGTPVGQISQGGETQYYLHEISVTCLPADIPTAIEVDISGMNVGEALHVSDLSAEGVTFNASDDTLVVTVQLPRVHADDAAATEAAE